MTEDWTMQPGGHQVENTTPWLKTQNYKPLGLTQVCEIRDTMDLKHNRNQEAITLIVREYTMCGFDPSDVRQAAEEALENLRAG